MNNFEVQQCYQLKQLRDIPEPSDRNKNNNHIRISFECTKIFVIFIHRLFSLYAQIKNKFNRLKNFFKTG